MTKKEQIIEKYRSLGYKKSFKYYLADVLQKSHATIAQNWFKTPYNIPKKHQDKVLEELDRQIELDKKINQIKKEFYGTI